LNESGGYTARTARANQFSQLTAAEYLAIQSSALKDAFSSPLASLLPPEIPVPVVVHSPQEIFLRSSPKSDAVMEQKLSGQF